MPNLQSPTASHAPAISAVNRIKAYQCSFHGLVRLKHKINFIDHASDNADSGK